jgi:hypothetical protein
MLCRLCCVDRTECSTFGFLSNVLPCHNQMSQSDVTDCDHQVTASVMLYRMFSVLDSMTYYTGTPRQQAILVHRYSRLYVFSVVDRMTRWCRGVVTCWCRGVELLSLSHTNAAGYTAVCARTHTHTHAHTRTHTHTHAHTTSVHNICIQYVIIYIYI